MLVSLNARLKERLVEAGIEVLWTPGAVNISEECTFEPPCSLKWMRVEHSLTMGAFSYAVSGYYFAVRIGRYCSFGEQVQMGRGDHPTNWLSTNPFQYLNEPLFAVGKGFAHAEEYLQFQPPARPPGNPPTRVKPIMIGNDVWIGHGALVLPGVKIGDGAIVGAHAVVTKDVAPYSVVVGNSGRVVKQRFPDEIVSDLLELKWWRFAPWQMRDVPFHDIRSAVAFLKERASTLEAYKPDTVLLKSLLD